jgi:Pentapeptide repeats (8 copies)
VELASALLVGAVLHDADLEGAGMWSTILTGADLRGSDLTEADLTSAKAHGARFECIDDPVPDDPKTRTNPRCTDLTGTVLNRADLTYSNLSGAKLDYVTMSKETDLTGAVLNEARLIDICYESGTKWPRNFSPPPARTTDCKTDESLDVTMMELSAAMQQGLIVDPSVYISRRCLPLFDLGGVKWLRAWNGPSGDLDESTQYHLAWDSGRFKVTSTTGTPKSGTARMAIAADTSKFAGVGSWTYDRDIRRWQFDSC